MKEILIKPKLWGDGYYMDSRFIPFKREGDKFIECSPIKPIDNFKPRVYNISEVELKEEK